MSSESKFGGLAIVYDTAVSGNAYEVDKTLIILHGLMLHSGIFIRLLPLASEHKCRIVLVNRRGYPGAEPLGDQDWALLRLAQSATPEGAEAMTSFLRNRGHDVHAFLTDLIHSSSTPMKRKSVILVGWSSASAFIIAMLAHSASFPDHGVNISHYLRRIITYDPPDFALGMETSLFKYQPLADDGLLASEKPATFQRWVSGYFNHPDIENYVFEERTPLENPPPTLTTINPDQLAKFCYLPPLDDGGQDAMILKPSVVHESVRTNVRDALAGKAWEDVEWRYIWCDMSASHMPSGFVFARKERDAAEAESRKGRIVDFVRWQGANHFVHWEKPGEALKALLADEAAEVSFV